MGKTRLSVGISARTLGLYSAAWNAFYRVRDRSTNHSLDEALVKYIEGLSMHLRKQTAARLLSAVNHFFPERVKFIPTLRRYAKQLQKAFPGGTKPPMLEEVAWHVAYSLMRRRFPVTAIGVLLQFECYLRPAELCSIQRRHIVFPGGRILGNSITKVLVLLPKTKTGILQSVDVRSSFLIQALRRLTRVGQSTQLMFPDYRVYANRLHSVLKRLGLGHLGYTPHAIRHGGATRDLINLGYPGLAQIMYRGRWESLAGRRYLQRGAASLLYAELPQQLLDDAPMIRRKLITSLRDCPLHPQS